VAAASAAAISRWPFSPGKAGGQIILRAFARNGTGLTLSS
jgi:hypothetical protein